MDLPELIAKAEAIIASTGDSMPEGATRAAYLRGEGADEKMATFILLTKAAAEAQTTLSALAEEHHNAPRFRCGARVTMVVEHYNGQGQAESPLFCSLPPHGPETDHKDQVCCWRFHSFPFDSAEPNVEDVWEGRSCSCGRNECRTRAILEGAL